MLKLKEEFAKMNQKLVRSYAKKQPKRSDSVELVAHLKSTFKEKTIELMLPPRNLLFVAIEEKLFDNIKLPGDLLSPKDEPIKIFKRKIKKRNIVVEPSLLTDVFKKYAKTLAKKGRKLIALTGTDQKTLLKTRSNFIVKVQKNQVAFKVGTLSNEPQLLKTIEQITKILKPNAQKMFLKLTHGSNKSLL